MDTFLSIVFLFSAVAVFPAFALSIVSTKAVGKHLAREHPALWAKIAPVGGQSNLSSPFARFITQRRYQGIADPILQALGARARRRLYTAMAIFMVVLFSGLSAKLMEQL